MPSKIIHATRDAKGYHFLVHLDTEVTVGTHEAHELSLPAGSPHPHFLRNWDFGHLTPGVHQQDGKDLTEQEYLAAIEETLTNNAALELSGIRFYQPAPPAHEVVKTLHGKEL